MPVLLIFVALIIMRIQSFVLFHAAAEIFSVIVAGSIFLFAWNARKIIQNHFFLLIGIALLFIGMLDFLHTVTYEGMSIFTSSNNPNIPTQLWLAARFLLVFAFLISPSFIGKKINAGLTFVSFGIATALFIFSIFEWNTFPTAFVTGSGLTIFKKLSEVGIIIGFSLSMVLLNKHRDKFDHKVFLLLQFSLLLNICSDVLFALYLRVNDVVNFTGHFFKVASYYAIYRAILEIGFREPYLLLFKELRETSERKDEFISIAGHELRTPITTIKLCAESLKRKMAKYKDARGLETAEKIDELGTRVSRMINDMLDLNRIEVNKLEVKEESVRIDIFLKKTLVDLRRSFHSHKIELLETSPITVSMDKDRIAQVISNFIGNAAKYSTVNSPIQVKQFSSGGEAIVEVQDFGIGISQKNITHIFDKYYRTRGGQKRAQGLGLGLFLSKEIIELHKGRIWVKSKKYQGSTFYFALPKRK